MKRYGFRIGEDRDYMIEADTEKEALNQLIDLYWNQIEENEFIILLGELTDIQKVLYLSDE